MKTIAKRVGISIGATLAGGALSVSAWAQTSYDLRALSLETGWTVSNNTQVGATGAYADRFNNADPLTGGAYTLGATTPAQIYGVRNNGFSAGSEAPVNDFFGTTYGVGRLRFSAADAIANPTNLDAAGTTGAVNRITLRDPDAGPFATSDRSISADASFSFVTPDIGSYYGLRLSDAGAAGTPFDDQIDLRIVQNGSGTPFLNLRRIASDGTSLTATGFGSVSVQSFLSAGKTLTDIAIVSFEMSYAGPGNGVRANAELLDATGARIGYYDFFDAQGIFPPIFRGESFTHVSAGANWTVSAVPEPGTYALMLAGLAGLGFMSSRRRKGAVDAGD